MSLTTVYHHNKTKTHDTVLVKEGEELFGLEVGPVSKHNKKSVNTNKKVRVKVSR